MLSDKGFFFVFENRELNKCTRGFPSVSSMTVWPCRQVCHTPLSAFKLGCKWVCECLEFYSALLLGEADFASSLTCPHLFLQAPHIPDHFQTLLLLRLLLFFFLFLLLLVFFNKGSGLALLFIT